MPVILSALLEAIVPTLIQQVGSLFPAGTKPADKYVWVEGAVQELIGALADKLKLPTWMLTVEGEAEVLAKEYIQKELEKIDPPAPTTPPAA